jgi:hypothetical protein
METAAGQEPFQEPFQEPLDEVAAHRLAREILQCPGWVAYAAQQPFLSSGSTHVWWVRARHVRMGFREILPITSRAQWEAARQRWGSD